MANPLNPIRLEKILEELELAHSVDTKGEEVDEEVGEDEVSMMFYGDVNPGEEEPYKTSQEPCQCSRNSKCQTKKFCSCFKNNLPCIRGWGLYGQMQK